MTLISREALVCLHLEQLAAIVGSDDPGPGGAVQASIILRVLMDENLLGRVGHDQGIDLQVPTPELSDALIGQALFFVCGGHRYGAKTVPPLWSFREPGARSPHRPNFEKLVQESREQREPTERKLSKFWKQPSLASLGVMIDRERVVRYVANKCGGAHHSDSADNFKDIDKLTADLGQAFQLQENGVSVVFSEVLGTAWYLLASTTVDGLRQRLSEMGAVLPDPGVPLAS